MSASKIVFGPFELHLRSRELHKYGRRVRLQEQPFLVLEALLEEPGAVVSRDQLRSRIWPEDTFVDFDTGLNAAVKRLRQALGDSADKPRYIETLPRVGYRFLASVTHAEPPQSVASSPASASRDRKSVGTRATGRLRLASWLVAGLLLVLTTAVGFLVWQQNRLVPAPVIAVLPFKNLSAQPQTDYFSDGLTDEIIRSLSTVDGLQVRSRTSSFVFKDKTRDLPTVGAQLNANLVLEGSVLRDGERVRVNAQLVRVSDDTPMWSGRYDRELKDVVAIQDEISSAIVTQLRLRLRTGRRRYETDPTTYDKYLRAQVLARRMPPGPEAELRESLQLLEEVVATDPSFAPAHTAMARLLSKMSQTRRARYVGAIDKARTEAERALKLDPLLAEAHSTIGGLYAHDMDWGHAESSYRRALELDPNLSEARIDFATRVLVPLGRMDEAVDHARIALELDPLSSEAAHSLLIALFVAQRYEETIQFSQRLLARDPNDTYVQHVLSRALAQEGKLAEAIALLENIPNAPANRRYLGYAYAKAGFRAEAERLAAEPDPAQFRQSALIYAGLGDVDRTLDALEKMAADGDPNTGVYTVFPEVGFLRGNARFAAIRQRQNLPAEPWQGTR